MVFMVNGFLLLLKFFVISRFVFCFFFRFSFVFRSFILFIFSFCFFSVVDELVSVFL